MTSIQTVSGELENNEKHFTCRFEDALNLTGFGKYNFYMTILSGFVGMALVLETIGFSYILPASQCDLGLTLAQKGWVGAIPFIGIMISSYFWGYLADTRGRKKTMMLSMFLGSICSMISSFSPTLPIFAALRLSSSALMSAANAVIFPYFGEFMPKKYVDSMVSILSTIIVFSTSVSSLIAWGVLSLDFRIPIDFLGIEYRPWRLMIICYAFPFILAVLIMMKASESPKFLMGQGKNDEVLKILQTMYAINTGKDKSDFPVRNLILDETEVLNIKSKDESLWHSIVDQTAPLFRPPLVTHILKFLVLAFGVYACANSFFVWLPDIIDRFYVGVETVDDVDNKNFCQLMDARSELRRNDTLTMDGSEISDVCVENLATDTYTLMIMFSCIIAGFNLILAGMLRITSKKVALLTMLSIGCIACFSLEWVHNKVLAWTLILLFQMNGILIGVINTYGVELIPSKHRSMAVCLIMMFGRLGSVTGTNLVGYLIETYCPANFYAYGGLLLACVVCSIFLPTSKRPDKK